MSLLSADYTHCALIVIDFQNDFILPGAPSEIAGSYAVLPQIAQLLESARQNHVPILHVVRCYLPDGSNVDLCRREMIQNGAVIIPPGSFGADFPAQLKPDHAPELDWDLLMSGRFQLIGPQEWVMYKSRWGAFYATNLEEFLRSQNIHTLIFCGCNFPNCPRTSIYQASERDFRLVLAQDAMSGIYEKGLQEMAGIGVTLSNTAQICEAFSL